MSLQIAYFEWDCDTATERDKYVKELSDVIKVDSYGSCLNNKVSSEVVNTSTSVFVLKSLLIKPL